MSASPEDLEKLHANKETEDAEYDEVVDVVDGEEYSSKLKSAVDMLKRNSVLFEFLADPQLVGRVTKREREIMLRQADKIDTLVDDLDKLLEEFE